MSLGKAVLRYEPHADQAGIHGNSESSKPPGTVTLTEPVEILTTSYIYRNTLQAQIALKTNRWHVKHVTPAKPGMRRTPQVTL